MRQRLSLTQAVQRSGEVHYSRMSDQPQTAAISSGQNLTASVGRNTLFGIIANGTQVVTRLVTVPIVIHHLGLGGYGIWNIIMMTSAYMRFGSVGVKTAFQKYVAEATGNGNYENANKLLSTGCAAMLALSVAVLIPISFFSKRIAHAAGVPPEFLYSAAGAIALLAWIMVMANVGAAFEAIVMGGHRIDLVRKFTTILTISEAVAIVVVLHFGLGLFAMSAVIGISEMLYIAACYLVSRDVVPQIRLRIRFVTRSVLYELFRFAGSYQLVNILEVLYASIIPFAILRAFGANEAGVYAVVSRVIVSAYVLLDAFLPPILSSGAMVYASGSLERMKVLLHKGFKVTLGLSLFPMGFIAVFGPKMAYAWTGQTDPSFKVAFLWVALTGIFRSFSLLSLVLYRVSGKAVMDNVRQVIRIVIIAVTAVFANKLGFVGALAGLTLAELVGMMFMIFALTRTFKMFRVADLLQDSVRWIVSSAVILAAGWLVSRVPLLGDSGTRASSTVQLAEVGLVCAMVAWPALYCTQAVTALEGRTLLQGLFPRLAGNKRQT
jgi:O-antigen/teichoic acid export membrane protein